MLAQIQTVDPIHLRDIVILIGFFLSAGASAVAILGQRRTQKREVSFADQFVTSAFCEKQHTNLTAEIKALQADRRGDVANLHNKIEAVAREVSSLSRAVELGNQRGIQTDNKLDTLIFKLSQ